ncbi:MAG TPA: tetratricopeptide repeat protein [Candidatus Sumerlaeota bacterium]|nr:tetratricopeptide repeat protein [Candidatus Sumerlaeota bacterium]
MGRFEKLEMKPEGAESTPAMLDSPGTSRKPSTETRPGIGEAEGTGFAGLEPLSGDAVLRAANDAFYTGDWRQALRHYSRALQMETTGVEPWVGQVLALLFLDQVREADIWSRRMLECFPDHPTAVSLSGLVRSLQGMTRSGIGSSDFAMSKGQADVLCWIVRGWMLLEGGNQNWMHCLDKAVEQCPPDGWRFHLLTGLVLERYKKWPQAVKAYQTAVDQKLDNYYLWSRLGHCYDQLGLARKALEAHQHALSLNPDYPPARKAVDDLSAFPLKTFLRKAVRLFRRNA